jgi:hypothetical protein
VSGAYTGGSVVVVVLFSHSPGEIAAVERGRDLAAALGLLGVNGRGKRQQQRSRKQREECASHTCHMLG